MAKEARSPTGTQKRVRPSTWSVVGAVPGAATVAWTAFGLATAVSVRDIAETVDRLFGPVSIEHIDGRKADYTGRRISSAQAKRLLGWSPRTNFADGVRRYADWYRATAAAPTTAG